MPKDSPVSPDEKQNRLAIIKQLIIAGHTKAEIVHKCQEEHKWGVTDRMVYYYVQDAWKEFAGDAPQVDRAAYFAVTVLQLDTLIGEAIKSKNLKDANGLIQTRVKLMKLDQPQADAWEQDAIEAGFDPAEVATAFLANRVNRDASIN